ncbi:HAD family hydrolase [Acinetobacter qingfengensis]|uniref:Hydrolase n=1 Tax=Acinetobacter qingfengensis TaxID=1262585 RepID=A0A1E7RDC7_9GAMM|nr:Cof-type HAD-IIB family hydrolase [Acinetobacter qingfengensis]KAA8732095.1 HAD family hydrolase [Acinetobacter qingfengensis]OEY97175.1 hydrolase [Acinetobacter qingfengensis]
MTIKLIAVDMDGTFLDDDKQYNKRRFLTQYQQLKLRNIHFVAASGNPYYTLRQYFPEIADEIAYVAENGAYVVNGQTEVAFKHFSSEIVMQVLQSLLPAYESALILCGKKWGTISQAASSQALSKIQKYFKQLDCIADLYQVKDPICKITLNTEVCDPVALQQFLSKQDYIQKQQVKMVSSGFGFIDLIIPGQHKAQGLQILQQKWKVSNEQMLAIGDNHNDIEMIQAAKYGFAMENAVPALKAIAKYHTASNAQQGVLDVLDLLLNAEPPFDHHSSLV